MKKLSFLMAALALSAFVMVGCGDKKPAEGDGHTHKDGDGHTHTDGDGHDHGKDGKGGHEHEGTKNDLGEHDLGGTKVSLTQIGDFKAGEESVVEVGVSEAQAKNVSKVKVWLGDAAGVELSAAVMAEGDGKGDFDAHLNLPKEVKDGAKYWVKVTTADGKSAKASWAPKK